MVLGGRNPQTIRRLYRCGNPAGYSPASFCLWSVSTCIISLVSKLDFAQDPLLLAARVLLSILLAQKGVPGRRKLLLGLGDLEWVLKAWYYLHCLPEPSWVP